MLVLSVDLKGAESVDRGIGPVRRKLISGSGTGAALSAPAKWAALAFTLLILTIPPVGQASQTRLRRDWQ
jgi:hypothetical protein